MKFGNEYESVVDKIDNHIRIYDPVYKDKIWLMYKMVEFEIQDRLEKKENANGNSNLKRLQSQMSNKIIVNLV